MNDCLKYLAQNNPDYADQINKTGKLPDELAGKITAVIKDRKSGYDFAESGKGVD
jgi:hypothetical protein